LATRLKIQLPWSDSVTQVRSVQ